MKKLSRPVVELENDYLSPGPWIFGRQVLRPETDVEPGALVDVHDASGRFVASALYNPASDIRLRILSRGKKSDLDRPKEWLQRTLSSADRLRRRTLGLSLNTNAYRVAHAEGDDLPGLVVDRLADVLVAEYHSLGFWRLRGEVEWALESLYPEAVVVHRVPAGVRSAEDFEPEEDSLDVGERELNEYGVRFLVAPGRGHKTGFFCDQRDNRRLVAGLCKGADVLDLCCNIGGFSLHAAAAGARSVRAVDLDEVVLERAAASAQLNSAQVEFLHADVFPFCRSEQSAGRQSRVVILDPHKIIAGKRMVEEGLKKYGDMNALALGCVRPGGILATFSCSGALDLESFVGMVFRAARRAERDIRVLEVLGAGPDHPQRPDFPRSRYLKGLLLAVD
ncbi:MAG: class I SAM-dependent rRNA methyltransferase [bacterium]|nr:class I SAM-dependent rRNA methyltransferase [Planctomycetota bacterium]HIL52496.1 class I SAM-dependent rRNA methyltransferase [Planctomycetota bacterium]